MDLAKRRTSKLWNYFTPTDENFAKCDICKIPVSYKTSTSNLKRHMGRKHPTVNLNNTANIQEKSSLSINEKNVILSNVRIFNISNAPFVSFLFVLE